MWQAPGRMETLSEVKQMVSKLKICCNVCAEASNQCRPVYTFLYRVKNPESSALSHGGDCWGIWRCWGGRGRVSSFLANLFLSLLHRRVCGKLPRNVRMTAVLRQREPVVLLIRMILWNPWCRTPASRIFQASFALCKASSTGMWWSNSNL